MARGNTRPHLHCCQSTSSPHLPFGLDLSLSLQMYFHLTSPRLLEDFRTVQTSFPVPISPLFLETRQAQHADAERSLPSIRCVRVASTPVLYFPSKQNSLQESPVTAFPLPPILFFLYPTPTHVLSMYSAPPHTSFWLPLYHTALSF